MTPKEPATDTPGQPIAAVIGALAGWCVRRPVTTILMFVAAAIAGAVIAAMHLKVDTDPSLMISNDLPSSSAYQRFQAQFPALHDTFIVIVDGDEAGKGRNAAGEIADAMQRRPDLFSDVFAPGNGPFFETNGVLYLPEAEVKRLAGDIKQMAPLFNAMTLQPDLAGIDDLFKQIAPVVEIGEAPDDVATLLDAISQTVQAARQGRPKPLNWETLGRTDPVFTETRWYVFAKPVLDYSALDAAAAPLAEVRRLMARFNDANEGIKVQLTGDAALNAEEFETVTKGAALAGVTSFILVTITVLAGLPAVLLVVPALALIVLGLAITAGIATLTVGYLNMISVAFAVLYIGLGVDYAVHVVLRFAEERAKGATSQEAALQAALHTGPPLALCTVTTSLAFLTFLLTDFVGMAQLGIISAAGVSVAFISSVTLIPAILSLLPLSREKLTAKFSRLRSPNAEAAPEFGSRLRSFATIILAALAVVSLLLLPQARFDGDPINLKDPQSAGMIAFNDFAERLPGRMYAVHLVAEPGDDLDAAARVLEALPEVASVSTITSVLPQQQDGKLAHLNALASTLPSEILASSPMSDGERKDYLSAILTSVNQMAASDRAQPAVTSAAKRLEANLERFLSARGAEPGALGTLETALVERFPPFFARIRQLATLGMVTPQNIASGFKERFVTADGQWRLEILPKEDMRDSNRLERFVQAVTGANPKVTGAPVDINEAADVVAAAILITYAAAFTLIVIVLFPVLRRVRDVALVLAPLMLAGVLMVGYTVAFGSPFNFANVIVLPLLLGLGVDSAIHYVMRARADVGAGTVSRTWTPRAVMISAFTTMGSFGTLWLSAHLGLASMGELLCVAVFFTLLCTLVVLPQLIEWSAPKRPRTAA